MKSKPLEVVVQVFLVDENDAGEVVDRVALEPRTFPAGLALEAFKSHLEQVRGLANDRTLELNAAQPNRAARRRSRSRKGGKTT